MSSRRDSHNKNQHEKAHDHTHGHGTGFHHHHHHHHHWDSADPSVRDRLLWALGLNAAFLFIEVVAAFWSDSLALFSDAGHMVMDVAALALAYGMAVLSARRPEGRYTYGFRRAPVLGALGNGLALLVMVAFILHEAFIRIQSPPEIAGWPVLITGVAGLAVNLVSALFLAGGHSHSLNVRGAMLHLIGDALGSVGAMVSGAVILLTGWRPIDPIISVFIALIILLTALPLVTGTIRVLLEASPSSDLIDRIRDFLRHNGRVKEVSDLHVWELDSGALAVTAYLLTDPEVPLHELADISDELRDSLKDEFSVVHAVLEWRCHPSPHACDTEDSTHDPSH